jgi:DNA polymerase III epsilon subunit-like protein
MLRFNKDQKYICFDFETCHLNLVNTDNKPWQLSYIIAKGNQIIKEVDNYIYWPDLKLSEGAKEVTHFDERKYHSLAADPKDILSSFEDYIYDSDYLIVGQNLLGFDVYIHNIYRKLLGKSPDFSYVKRILDTNCIAKAIKKNIKPQKDLDFTCWQYRLNDFREKGLKTSIKAQLKDYKIDFDESMLHNSMYDVQMNFKIFQKQLWQIEI